MLKRRDHTVFGDGVAYIYREKARKTDFNARKNPAKLEDMEFVVQLNFDEASKRTQDLEFAEQNGFQLSMKVRTRFVPVVEAKMKAVVRDYLYDIAYMDKSEREMFLYLESVRKVEEGENA